MGKGSLKVLRTHSMPINRISSEEQLEESVRCGDIVLKPSSKDDSENQRSTLAKII